MGTIIINNKEFETTIDRDILDGIFFICDNKDSFISIWENFTNESIKEFSYNGQIYYGLSINEISLRKQDNNKILVCFKISLKSDSDIFQQSFEKIAQTAINSNIINPWEINVQYKAGDIITYNKSIYRVIQSHTSQSDWLPDIVPSLYALLYNNEQASSDIPEWKQPDSTNPYMKGDKVIFENKIYESLIDNNVWSPITYPAGWQLIEE